MTTPFAIVICLLVVALAAGGIGTALILSAEVTLADTPITSPLVDTGQGTVTDNVTGLIWLLPLRNQA